MTDDSIRLIQKVWNFAHVLKDDGVSYGDYVEQITFLLFIKMAQEKEDLDKLLHRQTSKSIPSEYNWISLIDKDGVELEDQYRKTLKGLGNEKGTLGVIFRKAQNKITDPAKLKRLITLINEEKWSSLEADVTGDIYEGLLERNAQDVKGGAGQYFTPRPVIQAMVEVMKPEPGMTIIDPACGTGGFLLEAFKYIAANCTELDSDQKKHLKENAFYGNDIVDSVVRLCAMNLYLHGVGGEDCPIECQDSLLSMPSVHYDMVLTNPPFGKKSSITIINGDGKVKKESISYEREDFWATGTSNKQINFVQHIRSLLKENGRAAVVVPDNVLFEGGAGETVRRKLLETCDLHTILRLPTGIFYAQGVKANVIFFDRKPASETPWTKYIWIYDLRTNMHFTMKQKPLKYNHLEDFARCYNPENRFLREETERFKHFTYDEILKRDKVNLDITWLKDDSFEDPDNLPNPEELAQEIYQDLQSAMESIKSICEELAEDY